MSVRLSWGTTRAGTSRSRWPRRGRSGWQSRSLSGVALHPVEKRLEHAHTAQVDDAGAKLDGSHLVELWRLRAGFYPEDVELLERFMIDCLRAGDLAAEGHRVVARYAVEERLPLVACPVLLIAPTADPYAFPSVPGLDAALPHAKVTVIEGGMVPLPDQLPVSSPTPSRPSSMSSSRPELLGLGVDHAARPLDRGARDPLPCLQIRRRAARTAARSPRS